MVERKEWRKYGMWAAIALACVAVDVGFFMALGGAVKWIASLASPFVWAGVAAAGIVAARLIRMLTAARFVRADTLQGAVGG
jgi:hypothetical protein